MGAAGAKEPRLPGGAWLEKENTQHSFSNEAKTRALQAQQKEQELTQKMQQMEAQHDKTVYELDSLLSSQNTFISKLKEECCILAKKLESITEKNRSEISKLSQENKYVCDRLEKTQKRNDELEEQCIQHGRMHDKMKLSHKSNLLLIASEAADLL
uniref:Uncharacterized protein n=1 Tax=Sphaerodactylus townsendi TaxID=933632 RepID=A0ACB8GC87_9SAUR